jgi:hypothetical protein
MAKYHHYAIYFDGTEWHLDVDTEEHAFPNGTVYDTETKEWDYAYQGNGQWIEGEEDAMHQLQSMLNKMNQERLGV